MFDNRYATNWTLDGTPIEQGFDVMSDAEDELDELGVQAPTFAKAASRQATEEEKPEWVYTSSNPVEYQASLNSDGIEYRLSVLSDGERWHWLVADEAENIVAEGTSPEKPEAQRSAQTAATELAGRMVGEPVRSKRAYGPPMKPLIEEKRYPGKPIEFPKDPEDRYVGRGGEWYDGYTDAMRGQEPRTFGTEEYFDGYSYGQQIRGSKQADIASDKPSGWYIVAPTIKGYNDIDGPFETKGDALDTASDMGLGDEVVYHEQTARPHDPYKSKKQAQWVEEDGDLFHMPSSDHPNVATINGQTFEWEVLDPQGSVIASGSATSVDEAKQQIEQAGGKSSIVGLMEAKKRINTLNDDKLLSDGLRIAEEMERVGAEEREALQRIHDLVSDEILRRGLEGT